jgi:hypothetical protein
VGFRPQRRMAEHTWQRLLIGLELGDVDQQIGRTWIAAQDLCRLYGCRSRYAADNTCTAGSSTTPAPPSPNYTASPAPPTASAANCSPTSTPMARPTDRPKRSTPSSKRPNTSATATATSPTTGSPYCCTAASSGTLPNRHGSESGYHDWPRRDSLKVDGLVASTGRTGACGGTAPMESFLRPAAEDRPQPGDYQDRTHLLAGGGNVGSANSPRRALKCCSTRSHKQPESTHPPSH